jgi:hypothetical protein
MDIQLHEPEDLVLDVERDPYRSDDLYVGHAVSLLHAHATWFTEDRAEFSSEIAARFAAAKPGS